MKNNILHISPSIPTSNIRRLRTAFKNKIAIAQGAGLVLIPVTDILYCQAQSNYCKIILKSGKEYLVSKTLKRIQEVLNPKDFIKVHQSYLVSMDSIVEFNQDITLENAHKIPVARSQRKAVLANITRQYALV